MGCPASILESESRLVAYVEALTRSLGRADRAAPFRSYCTGLLLPGARKSVEPMAARVEPGRVRAAHQSLHHFVAKADWSDEALLAAVRANDLPIIERPGSIRGWMIDDIGVPKKGTHSVGVARQYCGQLGKQDNCQVAVTLSLTADHASLPIAHRLYIYLPQPWADDPARRAAAGVPSDVTFQIKPQIALAQIRAAIAAGVPQAPVLADAGYGIDTAFGMASPRSAWPMSSASSPTPACGRRAWSRRRPNPGVGVAAPRPRSAATSSTPPCRPRPSRPQPSPHFACEDNPLQPFAFDTAAAKATMSGSSRCSACLGSTRRACSPDGTASVCASCWCLT